MGKNVFVSYKYADTLVNDLNKRDLKIIGGQLQFVPRKTRVRDYVDLLQEKLGKDHTNLGEKDGESLEDFSDEKIESELKKKIYRSSVTIVMISKGMKDPSKKESEQWVPWEISYSMRVVKREDSTSLMNAVLGIVLPDENNSYEWYYTENKKCDCITHHYGQLFQILKSNMFNILEPTIRYCDDVKINEGEFSFIKTVKWVDFNLNHNYYIDKAIEIRDNAKLYDTKINID